MSSTRDGELLVGELLAALARRQWDEFEGRWPHLVALAEAQPTVRAAMRYFEGVLANERDRDPARAERIFRQLLTTDLTPRWRSRVLLALGRTYDYQSRWDDAVSAYFACLPILADLGLPVEQAKAWKNIAIAYLKGFEHGDLGVEVLDPAAQYCRLALDTLGALPNPAEDDLALLSSVWHELGTVYTRRQAWNDAITCFEHEIALCQQINDPLGIGLAQVNLGEVYHERSRTDWPQALTTYQSALELIRAHGDAYDEADILADLGALHHDMGDLPLAVAYYTQAVEHLEALRGGMTSEAARAGFLADVADIYAHAILAHLDAGQPARAFNIMEQSRSRAFLDALEARSPELARQVYSPPATLREVQSALPPDTMLLEYFTTGLVEAREGRIESPALPRRHRFPPPRTLLFAVTADALHVFDTHVSPNDLRPASLDGVVERHFLAAPIRRTLYDRLLGPVAADAIGRRRLYIAPHGPLHYIPFQALVAPDGQPLLREDGPQVVHAPSATYLLRGVVATPSQAPLTCLAIGYNGQGEDRLQYAEAEAETVARLQGGSSVVGDQPKKNILYREAKRYRLLHLSCHGVFTPEDALLSALYTAPAETLTALDVLENLELDCDLVTISACESGLSRVRRGDELVGLTRAFAFAGARAYLSTLWRVDERSTQLLMTHFYGQVQAGRGFAEALRRAQLELCGHPDFSQPQHWAAFVLVGHLDRER
ncbi:MAG: CHAT domain-containing tetratricopeptide repeat protein [Anaerolineae bacterium]